MAGRKIRDEAEARRCLGAVASSGLTQSEWTRREGIDGRSLNTWRMNLARRGGSGRARLVELVTVGGSMARYTVRWGDFAVEVRDDFDPQVLYRLLQVVSAC